MNLFGINISRERAAFNSPTERQLLLGIDGFSDSRLPKVTTQSATGVPAYYSAIRHIADTVASLPYDIVYEDSQEPVPDQHPFRLLMERPNPLRTRNDYVRMLLFHLLVNGNAPQLKIRNGLGQTVRLRPLDAIYCNVRKLNGDPDLKESYVVEYSANGDQATYNLEELVWLSDMAYDGVVAASPLSRFRDSFALAMALRNYSSNFFANNARPFGILTVPSSTSDEEMTAIKSKWEAQNYRNDAAIAVMRRGNVNDPSGSEFQAIVSNPDEAMALPLAEFTITEIARATKLPVTMLGLLDNGTYANVAEERIAFARDTIAPWLQVLENGWAELGDEYPRPVRLLYDVTGLTRGSQADRYDAYAVALNAGFLTVDEIRAQEGLPPLSEIPTDEPEPEPEPDDEDDNDADDAQDAADE